MTSSPFCTYHFLDYLPVQIVKTVYTAAHLAIYIEFTCSSYKINALKNILFQYSVHFPLSLSLHCSACMLMITEFLLLCLEATDQIKTKCLINANFINSVLTFIPVRILLVCSLRASALLSYRPHPDNHYGKKKKKTLKQTPLQLIACITTEKTETDIKIHIK